MDAKPMITWIEAKPLTLSMAQRDAFRLTLIAKNVGPDTLDPKLMDARLRVNGLDSEIFSSAATNGLRGEEWFLLPPGQQASIKWDMWTLFEAPGEYELVLDWWGEHAPVTVVVTE